MHKGSCICDKVKIEIKDHIFVKDKGDYYDLNDGLPKNSVYPGHENNEII